MKRHADGMLHIIDKAPRVYFMSHMDPSKSPYLERLHVLFGRITQAGLVDKWDEDTKCEMKLEFDKQVDASDVEIAQKNLKLSDVAGNYIILTVRLVCTAVFWAELCVCKTIPLCQVLQHIHQWINCYFSVTSALLSQRIALRRSFTQQLKK
jgi:hypothetical protein